MVDSEGKAPYWKRWWTRAWKDTWAFWNLNKTVTYLLAPILSLGIWTGLGVWRGWAAALEAIGVTVASYGGSWCLVLVVELLRAPGKLDAQLMKDVKTLEGVKHRFEEQLAKPVPSAWDQEQRRLVQGKMENFSDREKSAVRYVLQHGQVDTRTIEMILGKEGMQGLQKGRLCNLVQVGGPHVVVVNPNFTPALSFYFHGE